MAGNWTDDCIPVQRVFGRSGDVVAVAGDYSADQVLYDAGLSLATPTPADVGAALDELYKVSPLGDRAMRVANDEFTSPVYIVGGSVQSIADNATIGSGATNAAVSNGMFGWNASSALADLRRDPGAAASSVCGAWTIRSSGTATGTLKSRSTLYPGAVSRVRVAFRIQLFPVAQTTGVGLFDSALTNAATVEFHTLSGSVFAIRLKNSKAGVNLSYGMPYTTVNEVMTVVYTLSNFGKQTRIAIYDAAGLLVGPIFDVAIPAANQIAAASAVNAGVFSTAVSNPANTPLVLVDYGELGLSE